VDSVQALTAVTL